MVPEDTDFTLKAFFECSSDAMLLISAENRVKRINPASTQMFACEASALLEQPLSVIFSEKEDLGSLASLINNDIADRPQKTFSTHTLIRQNKTEFSGRITWLPVIKNGSQGSRILVIKDITEYLTLTHMLEANEAPEGLVARTVALAKVGGWQVNLETMKLSWTAETFRIAEIAPPNEPSLEEGINLFAPEARQTIADAVEAAMQSGKPYDLVLPIITAKGRHLWVRTQGYGYFQNGKISRIYGTFQDITKQIQADQALRQSEERWRFALTGAGDGIWDWNVQTNKVEFSSRWKEMLGYADDEIGDDVSEWSSRVHKEDMPHVQAQVNAHIHGKINYYKVEHRLKCKDGSWKWILARGLVMERDQAGNAVRFIGTHTDISQHKEAEMEIRVAAAAFSTQEGIIITDANRRILRINQAFEKISGYKQSEVINKTPSMFSSGRHDKRFYDSIWQALSEKGLWHGEIWDRRKNGEIYPQSVSISVVRDEKGEITHYVGTFVDMSDIKKAHQVINKLSYYDSLTGLVNRDHFMSLLQNTIEGIDGGQQYSGLLKLGLDNFSTLNGVFGQKTGDAILIEVSSRLQRVLRQHDVISRYGGDEFLLLLRNLGNTSDQALHALQVASTKLTGTIEAAFEINHKTYFTTCSGGATMFQHKRIGADCMALIKQVDIATANAKQLGGSRVEFYDPQWEETISARAMLLNDLRAAVTNNEFEMFYQPQLDNKGTVVGVEALVRWNHPERGLLNPGDFIPLAEANSLIEPLSEIILHSSLKQLQRWQQTSSTQHLQMSINITAEQLYSSVFADQLHGLITDLAIDPSGVMLEITESMLLKDIGLARRVITQLQQYGISFAIDDFGTGYSSLASLSQLSLNLLKIDQSFIHNIGKNEKDLTIIRTIIEMAKTLGMNVLAEGVETEAQKQYLQDNGCQYYQGFLFAKPMSVAAFNQWVS